VFFPLRRPLVLNLWSLDNSFVSEELLMNNLMEKHS